MSDGKYKASGYFANRGIGHFAPCVIDGQLDEAKAISAYGLNERQMPGLRAELYAAGYLKENEAPIEPRQLVEGEMLEEGELPVAATVTEVERTTAPLDSNTVGVVLKDEEIEIDVTQEHDQ